MAWTMEVCQWVAITFFVSFECAEVSGRERCEDNIPLGRRLVQVRKRPPVVLFTGISTSIVKNLKQVGSVTEVGRSLYGGQIMLVMM